mmetsp:Transcript_34348/g.74968  ORF Transcript_34348/g.74968 Transcript_34348/m.74968 type:complete len:289 (+) Transcript_34348:540-1406(+)
MPIDLGGFCQEDVLQRDVPVRDAHLVQPPHGAEDLGDDGSHDLLALPARRGVAVAPVEEVAAGAEGRHDVGLLLVREDAQELADIGVPVVVQVLDDTHVIPRPLRCRWVGSREFLRPTLDPLRGHDLHGHLALGAHGHQVYTAVISNRVLQQLHRAESFVVEWFRTPGELRHDLIQFGWCQARRCYLLVQEGPGVYAIHRCRSPRLAGQRRGIFVVAIAVDGDDAGESRLLALAALAVREQLVERAKEGGHLQDAPSGSVLRGRCLGGGSLAAARLSHGHQRGGGRLA